MKKIIEAAEKRCQPMFARIDEIALENTAKVLDALQRHEVAARHFAPTTGYGYDDIGRDTLEKLFADLFHADAAIVRPQIASGTHALSMCLFGLRGCAMRRCSSCFMPPAAPMTRWRM